MAWSWMPGSRRQQAPLGADKNYDTRGCVDALRCTDATPHVAQNTSNRSSAIDGRATRHSGYAMSQRYRKRIEECFGWARVIGGMRKGRLVGREKLDFPFALTMSACNTGSHAQSGDNGMVTGKVSRVSVPGNRFFQRNGHRGTTRLAKMGFDSFLLVKTERNRSYFQ